MKLHGGGQVPPCGMFQHIIFPEITTRQKHAHQGLVAVCRLNHYHAKAPSMVEERSGVN